MQIQKIFNRGTEINKIPFSDIESYLEEKNLNVMSIFNAIADEREFVYVSNGFVRGLYAETNEEGEWHHYFKKDSEGDFFAGKLNFN